MTILLDGEGKRITFDEICPKCGRKSKITGIPAQCYCGASCISVENGKPVWDHSPLILDDTETILPPDTPVEPASNVNGLIDDVVLCYLRGAELGGRKVSLAVNANGSGSVIITLADTPPIDNLTPDVAVTKLIYTMLPFASLAELEDLILGRKQPSADNYQASPDSEKEEAVAAEGDKPD